MKRRAKIIAILVTVAGVAVAMRVLQQRTPPRQGGPLTHEAYVWQRAWTEPVRSAVAQHATNFSALAVLKAEVSWKDKKPQVTRVAVGYATLAHAQRPIGIALRIGPYAGPFAIGAPSTASASFERQSQPTEAVLGAPIGGSSTPGEAITTFLCDLAASLVAEARTNHLNLSELQIDFDCAESKLDGYRLWVEAIQQRVAPLPVTITALPSWLNASAFKRLAAVATNYVLQVHSSERPTDIHAPFTLCDPRAAQRAVERAGRIGVPFRVALPTYGYVLAFDRAGKFIGLSAEGPRKAWPEGAQLREVNSNPVELSILVREWTASRPKAMMGVIWYRLPVAVDNLNWRWPTLAAIVATRVPRKVLRVSARRVESGLVEISLANEGDLDISSRFAVEVRWSDARLVAGNGQRGFELAEQAVSTAKLETQSQSIRLPAGEKFVIGWLRFDRNCEVQLEVRKF
jgi:hypothetical protein